MYKATYKCRLCGAVYHRGGPADEESRALVTATMIAAGVKISDPMAPTPQAVHVCRGRYADSIGVADFLGFEKETKE